MKVEAGVLGLIPQFPIDIHFWGMGGTLELAVSNFETGGKSRPMCWSCWRDGIASRKPVPPKPHRWSAGPE